MLTLGAIHTSVDVSNWENEESLFTQNQLKPTIAYYDWNVGSRPLYSIDLVVRDSPCLDGFTEVEALYKWPGSVQLCSLGESIRPGVCGDSGLTYEETETAALNGWRNGRFCV